MNPSLRFFACIILSLLVYLPLATSQRTTDDIRSGFESIGSSQVVDTTEGLLPLESPAAMAYVKLEDPEVIHIVTDTFIWDDNRHHPLAFYQSDLGNYGSPYRSLIPHIRYEPGFSTGWHLYDPYFLLRDSIRFYHQDIPVVKAKYSTAGKDDSYFTLNFGRKFAKGFSLSIMYNRINQLGEFARQMQTNTALGIGVWHNSPSGRYDGFYSFASNTANGEENGGIAAPEQLFSDSFDISRIPVFIQNGNSSQRHRVFTTKQIVHIAPLTDKIGFDIWMQADYATDLYRFSDVGDVVANLYYPSIFLNDTRGIRQFTFTEKTSIEAGVALPWKAAHSTLSSSIQFNRIQIEQEPITTRLNEIYWRNSGLFQWVEPLVLKGSFDLGLGAAGGTYSFNAEGTLNTKIVGALRGYYFIQNRKPYLIESSLFINQLPVYSYNFSNPVTNEFGVEWLWPKQDLKAGLKWIIYDEFIYFDALALPAQISEAFSFRQIYISKGLDVKWVGIKGHVIWQPETKEELALPSLLYKASLYGRFKLFRQKATVMPGIDVIYHDNFQGVSYFPVTGQYHLTTSRIPETTRIDAALGVHINFLKIFVRMEDVTGFFKERVIYQADLYPQYRGYIRFGVQAGFFN
jgi:hypothetical protein